MDLKPEHFRIGKAGQLVLIDWGGAWLEGSCTNHEFHGTEGLLVVSCNNANNIFACQGWRAPELAGLLPYLASPAADVYSAGLVLGWLLRRLPAFKELCPRASEAFGRKNFAFEVLLEETETADLGYLLAPRKKQIL
jgi:hypothetical protein